MFSSHLLFNVRFISGSKYHFGVHLKCPSIFLGPILSDVFIYLSGQPTKLCCGKICRGYDLLNQLYQAGWWVVEGNRGSFNEARFGGANKAMIAAP